MRELVLCAPDKLRGALTAVEAAAALARGARAAGFDAIEHPLADGGEGTRGLIAHAGGGRLVSVPARDARGRALTAPIALLPDGTAIVEAADAIGLGRLPARDRDPWNASSAGLADLIRGALEHAPRRLIVCLGGSATVDGGLGLLAGLGAVLTDANGERLAGCGADLERIARIDLAGVDPRVSATAVELALDVSSPLHGRDGAAVVFGPQKGADPAMVARLDAGLARLAPLLGRAAAIDGAGAAGGLGAALALLGAAPRVGAEVVMEVTAFPARLSDAVLCLTAEGRVDVQTAAGKTAARVVDAGVAAGVPVVVIGGAVGADARGPLHARGATAILAASDGPGRLRDALNNAGAALARTAEAACRLFAAGRRST